MKSGQKPFWWQEQDFAAPEPVPCSPCGELPERLVTVSAGSARLWFEKIRQHVAKAEPFLKP